MFRQTTDADLFFTAAFNGSEEDTHMHTDCINAESPAAPPAARVRFYMVPACGPGAGGPEVEMIVFRRPGGGLHGNRLLPPLLLAQELEDGGEVFVGVAAGAHDPEDLVGQ